jgi:hypothetical protein
MAGISPSRSPRPSKPAHECRNQETHLRISTVPGSIGAEAAGTGMVSQRVIPVATKIRVKVHLALDGFAPVST